MNKWSRFNETNNPLIDKYDSKLNNIKISKQDHIHSNKVWDTFKIKDLGIYHDLYLQTDVTLLADVFESFRKMCLEIYELDPVRFVSAPNLAWQACLKITDIELQLLIDVDMLLMFENGIRGGTCQAIVPNINANNKYMNNYVKELVSSYLMYLDANNLYGGAMCRMLPDSEFNFVDPTYFDKEYIKNYDDNYEYGALLEVDIEYSKEIKFKHEDLAFLPEKRKINNVNKLVTTLKNKKRYVVHISALKQALNHGLKLKKVHRVIQFKQNAWLKPYIMKNIKLRMNATNEFEKNFFKLMNNAVFGKTIENVRNYRDVKLVNTYEQMNKHVKEPTFTHQLVFQKIVWLLK